MPHKPGHNGGMRGTRRTMSNQRRTSRGTLPNNLPNGNRNGTLHSPRNNRSATHRGQSKFVIEQTGQPYYGRTTEYGGFVYTSKDGTYQGDSKKLMVNPSNESPMSNNINNRNNMMRGPSNQMIAGQSRPNPRSRSGRNSTTRRSSMRNRNRMTSTTPRSGGGMGSRTPRSGGGRSGGGGY